MTTPPFLRAFRDHADDDEALRAALEAAVDNLSEEHREVLAHGFQLPGDAGRASDSLHYERLPTEDVLADRDLLVTHRDLLDDHWSLMDAMPSMYEAERAAASRFISRMRKTSGPETSVYDEAAERWRLQGYMDMASAPRGSALLSAIEQAERFAGEDSGIHPPSTYATLPEFVDVGSLPHVPDQFVMPDSRNHVLPGVGHAVRLYSRSTFDGALLMVEQTRADAFLPRHPSLTIAGHPGNVSWTLHRNGAWTTTVAGYDGRSVHHITVEAKLKGAERDEFVRFAIGIIEAASLMP